MANGQIGNATEKKLYDFLTSHLLVSFFSTSCESCLPVMDGLNNFLTRHTLTNSIVLFDSTDNNTNFLKDYFKGSTPVFTMPKKLMQKEFSVFGVPSIFLLNKLGQVLYSELGYSDETFHHIESVLLRTIK
ncbi:TlpA family protein disulfide reductase [Niallia taxi]|uniref:TlpA family protein disulfide reductase n=1 Tax=Niallia taxi TaxID=2499688 RepID=UPI003009FAFA